MPDITDDNKRSRGLINENEITPYLHLTSTEIHKMLHSKNPVMRSIAAVLFRKKININDSKTAHILAEALKKETQLYTRLELCRTLENGEIKTAEVMCDYLGKIGKNQYHTLPDRPSLKKSYPLPRDIIARSLARMDPVILPVLTAILKGRNEQQISEILDAIGFLIFYNSIEEKEKISREIIIQFEKYKHNPLIQWKCITCLSAFSDSNCTDTLTEIINSSMNPLFVSEAKRSLSLIQNRNIII